MDILFTGASSFSGLWFVKELVATGHRVTAVFKRPIQEYSGVRKQRVDLLLPHCESIFGVSFGDPLFQDIISKRKHWDLYCHHAADVTDYRSAAFDAPAALANNTKNLKSILQALQKSECNKILLTGSVFEQNEGAGSDELRAVSPYGLSKGLTSDTFRYYTDILKMKLGKFVIPNPFGPYEEGRFTTYLIQNWIQGKSVAVNTPAYVRDNIHVTLLAKAYAGFAARLSSNPGFEKCNPSGYIESQGSFTRRFANAMQPRLNIECPFQLNTQTDFNEPMIRINTDTAHLQELQWNETRAWDELSEYYKQTYAIQN